jgi:hypothetical protein
MGIETNLQKEREMWLHFVGLEHNKMFLHMTTSETQWPDIVQQLMVYKYCRDNLPQRIVFSMPLNEDTPYVEQVDENVRLFRDLFGEEDTCGGSTPEVHLLESTQIAPSTDPCLSTVQG